MVKVIRGTAGKHLGYEEKKITKPGYRLDTRQHFGNDKIETERYMDDRFSNAWASVIETVIGGVSVDLTLLDVPAKVTYAKGKTAEVSGREIRGEELSTFGFGSTYEMYSFFLPNAVSETEGLRILGEQIPQRTLNATISTVPKELMKGTPEGIYLRRNGGSFGQVLFRDVTDAQAPMVYVDKGDERTTYGVIIKGRGRSSINAPDDLAGAAKALLSTSVSYTEGNLGRAAKAMEAMLK